jgi:hypothetical protein
MILFIITYLISVFVLSIIFQIADVDIEIKSKALIGIVIPILNTLLIIICSGILFGEYLQNRRVKNG